MKRQILSFWIILWILTVGAVGNTQAVMTYYNWTAEIYAMGDVSWNNGENPSGYDYGVNVGDTVSFVVSVDWDRPAERVQPDGQISYLDDTTAIDVGYASIIQSDIFNPSIMSLNGLGEIEFLPVAYTGNPNLKEQHEAYSWWNTQEQAVYKAGPWRYQLSLWERPSVMGRLYLETSDGHTDLFTFTNESASVIDFEPVPEPATILLLGFGLISLAGFRRLDFNRLKFCNAWLKR